ncbi:MAG: T9SS type A sorting domain-containing protein [Ignavibacteriae bacterium]|nr:T9SS type A sorting domain-containing protein [Ignavibacteriota bacterium]
MKKILILFALLVFAYSTGYTQATDTLPGTITSAYTLNSSKRYLMLGEVRVKNGGNLVIPAGTRIYGEKTSKGSLIIERGGKINAVGTQTNPIIFTSAFAPGNRNAGDWGGIVILGKAKINTTTGADTAAIEGFASSIYYGGQDDNDSSGIMKYVRIEYSGVALAPNNEINGLTMGGVGRKTVIENIMVSFCGDDSYEWFGGTVNCKYLVSYNAVDDEFDTDNGYRGRVQFGLSIKHPNIADISGSNGFESDNNGAPNYNNPRTQPIFSNITFIGVKRYDTSTVDANHKRGMHLRRNSLQNVYNTIFMGYTTGSLFDGIGVANACNGDTIKYMSNIIAGISGKNFDTAAMNSNGFNASTWALNSARLNDTLNTNDQVMLTNAYGGYISNNWNASYFIPLAGSPALNSARVTNVNAVDPYFSSVNFRGAFGADNWAAGWTNFRPDTVNYNTVGISQISSNVPGEYRLDQNYPNPFNPSTKINFAITKPGFVSLRVYDITGKEIINLVNEKLQTGTYSYDFNATNLSSGIYFYTLKSDNFVSTKKMVLVK